MIFFADCLVLLSDLPLAVHDYIAVSFLLLAPCFLLLPSAKEMT